jgi:tRNA-2-methylthio-N6-dimethylallyladenosine synthase
MKQKNYFIKTFGCQMNKNDSERLKGLLENTGYTEADEWKTASLVILNTCSVRDKAERRVRGQFHALKHFREKNGLNMQLAIAGCMPQYIKEKLLHEMPFLDFIIGVNNLEILPELLLKKPSLSSQISLLKQSRKRDELISFENNLDFQKREDNERAWISIMFGCDNFCSYCIVPYTRGRETSRKKEDIFKEIELLKDKGYTKIVLLGQNVNSYGKKLYTDYFFPELLHDIAQKFTWLEKIEFLTSHPKDVNPALIDVMAAFPVISHEIHFPIQHGDDDVLLKMNRGYTVKQYKQTVAMIRKKLPDVRIGTDLITGFPGETEEQFQNMLLVVKEIGFDFANTAHYSIREGTKAASMPEQIPEDIKLRRLNELNRFLDAMFSNKMDSG